MDIAADYCENTLDLFPPLPDRQFEIIYVDPPWHYKGQLQHNGIGGRDTGGAVRHYPTIKIHDLKKLAVQKISAEHCLLFMWATSPHLDQAIDLGKAWGFQWATVAFFWYKEKPNPGFYTMSETELCLVFRHGAIPKPRGKRNIRQTVIQEVLEDKLPCIGSAKRKHHSHKPDDVRTRIEEMFPEQSKIELFARRADIKGWQAWGNEV